MKPQSCKAKGRRFQQQLRDDIRVLLGLEDGDVESRGMGQNGVDIILSPAALKVFPYLIEAKNVEALNVTKTFLDHAARYASQKQRVPLLVHTKNKSTPLVTMTWAYFLRLVAESSRPKQNND